jgi:thiol-disulfide isomerase/thioredoxin
VKLQTLDETKFADALKQYRGKVVLVDYWALWCSPCKELFPHTVQLYRELAGRGLAVVSISLDTAEKEPEVLKFLVAQQATFDNFLASHDPAEAAGLLQIENGTLPHLKLFDREGNLRRTFPKAQSAVNPAEVDEAVKELLGTGS